MATLSYSAVVRDYTTSEEGETVTITMEEFPHGPRVRVNHTGIIEDPLTGDPLDTGGDLLILAPMAKAVASAISDVINLNKDFAFPSNIV